MLDRRQRRECEHGAAAVEFALVVLPVIVLVFGLIQYGLYFWAMQGGSDIARSATRLAAVGSPADCAAFRSAIRDQIDDLSGSGSTATITRTYQRQTPTKVSVGDTVNVQVSFNSIDLHFPFLPFIHDGQVTSQAQARVDFVPTQPETCE